jgi:hypothetical protein
MPRPSDASALRDKVLFERRALVDDGAGNEDGPWTPLGIERTCALAPTRGGETVIAGRLSGTAMWDCWVRDDSGTRTIRTGDRAVDARDANRVWNVRFSEDMDGTREWRLIQLEAGVATG